MDSHGMLICPECKHLPALTRRRFGYQSLPTVPGQDSRALYTFAGLSLRDMERWAVWGIAPPKVKLDIDTDVPDRRELREPAEILALYRRERGFFIVESESLRTATGHNYDPTQGGDK